MTNYKATLLIDSRYAREHYNQWGTPEAAENDPCAMRCYIHDIVYQYDRDIREANGAEAGVYLQYADGGVQYRADDIRRKNSDAFFDRFVPGARTLIRRYIDSEVERQNREPTGLGYRGVMFDVIKTTEGKWELIAQPGFPVEVWREDGTKTEMSMIDAARYMTEKLGIAKWEEVE